MSILIKGINMPGSCVHCPLIMNCDDCEGFEVHCVPLGKNIGYKDEILTNRRREDCPIVPAKKIKHGYWMEWGFNIRCSVCGDEPYFARSNMPKYCPNCGARMDGEK